MASGLSILLPRIRIGTLAIVSSVISDFKGKKKGGRDYFRIYFDLELHIKIKS